MNRLRSPLLGLIIISLLINGCATLFDGTTQRVNFNSIPPGATVTVGGKTVVTPGIIDIDRGMGDLNVFVTKDGYEQGRLFLTPSIQSTYWLNFAMILIPFVGGVFMLIGSIVDIVNGAAYEYEDTYYCPLQPIPGYAPPAEVGGTSSTTSARHNDQGEDQEQIEALEEMRNNGLISEAEYQRRHMELTDPAYRALDRGRAAGVLSEEEYQSRRHSLDIERQRQQLEQLHEQGLLTDEEYRVKLEKIQ